VTWRGPFGDDTEDLEQSQVQVLLDLGARQSQEPDAVFLDQSLPEVIPSRLGCVDRPVDLNG
jgi:hypothetical protein